MTILHLEDNANDAVLVQSSLLDEWPDCEVQVVSNRADFLAALAKGPDVILSDFNMPGYNGLDALRLVRETAPNIPFIFLSGTIGEERALEAVRAGASDYVIKDRPKRLIPAVQRALNDARALRERQATQEQMQRVQRLENIGMLASGIAHDFNNVLAPLLMGLPLLRMRHPGESDQKIISNMENSAARGASLVKQILGFAHGVTGEAQLIQPGHLIDEIVSMMRQTFPKSITIVEKGGQHLWLLKANPTQFHQVLLNLCVNARDAMPQGGTITLHSSNREVTEPDEARSLGIQPGNYISLEVADSGTGIPPQILSKIWEPFFTTKGEGKGTGLGLSTVRGIIAEHKGSITVESLPGRGTVFRILLPATRGSEAAVGARAMADIPRGTGELILVVDDDASVREITSVTLTGHGYRALAASDGTEAVALFAPRNLEIRAVIADLDMPSIDGVALFRVVRALNPAVRVILVSGVADASGREIPGGASFLSKPFTGETLLRITHKVLNDPQGKG